MPSGSRSAYYEGPSPEYGHPDELRRVLKKTLRVPLFQEQAMRIAIVAAGFTPEETDDLRRPMATFKYSQGVGIYRDRLVEGMTRRGYPRDFAERCFKQIEGFGSYGFAVFVEEGAGGRHASISGSSTAHCSSVSAIAPSAKLENAAITRGIQALTGPSSPEKFRT